MKFNEIVNTLTNNEGGKSSIKNGDMREALSKLSVMMVKNPKIISTLIDNGIKKVLKNERK